MSPSWTLISFYPSAADFCLSFPACIFHSLCIRGESIFTAISSLIQKIPRIRSTGGNPHLPKSPVQDTMDWLPSSPRRSSGSHPRPESHSTDWADPLRRWYLRSSGGNHLPFQLGCFRKCRKHRPVPPAVYGLPVHTAS